LGDADAEVFNDAAATRHATARYLAAAAVDILGWH
jgi:hypothetical protein